MFGKFPRRNNRKARLSDWFAHERGSDMQSFDLHDLGSKLSACVAALRRDKTRRQANRPADEA